MNLPKHQLIVKYFTDLYFFITLLFELDYKYKYNYILSIRISLFEQTLTKNKIRLEKKLSFAGATLQKVSLSFILHINEINVIFCPNGKKTITYFITNESL